MSVIATNSSEYQWDQKPPNIRNDRFGNPSQSHYREIFISSPNSTSPRLVVKIETAEIRKPRLQLVLPHSEEISYKICKLFHWNSVPKTKILHQFSVSEDDQTEKLKKYVNVMDCFKTKKHQLTFTFQTYVEGSSLECFYFGDRELLSLSSYQKTYLLDMVLGKFDATDKNTFFNIQTCEFFEIDNEYIGKEKYETSGVLNHFKTLKSKELLAQVLDDVLKAPLTQLLKIRDKYKIRDKALKALWDKEHLSINYYYKKDDRNICWAKILKNFVFLKMSILALQKLKEPITIEKLENRILKLHTDVRCSDLFQTNYYVRHSLQVASILDKEGRLLKILIKELPTQIDEKENEYGTSLDVAIIAKNISAVQILIKNGAQVSLENRKSLEDKLYESVHDTLGIGASSHDSQKSLEPINNK